MEPVMLFNGEPGTTVKITASADTAYSLSDLTTIITKDNNFQRIVMLLITVETNPVRIAFGADASQTVGHFRAAGDGFQITGATALNNISFANATTGDNFVLQVTPFYLNRPTLT